ncbi:DUF5333 domain-containing protein [Aliiroseovarius sp. PTFE2010]|uniref:DUF5333 domain-containing protein n=1 Tax=Aliiroseovarius sp. PTFE2010 TaxID=3417190 RepID=UPI003CEEB91E
MTLSNVKTALLAGALGMTAASAHALPPLSSDKYVHDQLLAGFIGDKIDQHCDKIGARKLAALRKLYVLRDYARAKGYSDGQIKAFIDDKNEKAKLNAEAARYLAERGAKPGAPQSYCVVGYQEIQANSLTGRLLFTK